MKNYLKADFHRIMTKKSRIILMVLWGLVDFIQVFSHAQSAPNAIAATNYVGSLDFIYLNIIMLGNILVSFRDDFRAKSIQAALGSGVKRYQIVLTKWINMVLMAFLDITFLTILQFIPLIVLNCLGNSYAVGLALTGQYALLFLIAIAMSITLIVLFQTQNGILGVLAYVYLTLDITSLLVHMAISNKLVQRFQLWNIGSVDQMQTFLGKLDIGQFDFGNFIMIIFYFALGIGGAIYLFRKKELDF